MSCPAVIELAGRNERIFVKEHEIKKVMEGGGLMSGKKNTKCKLFNNI